MAVRVYLKQARSALRVSQARLAEAADVSIAWVRRAEEEPLPEDVQAWARVAYALGRRLDDLIEAVEDDDGQDLDGPQDG